MFVGLVLYYSPPAVVMYVVVLVLLCIFYGSTQMSSMSDKGMGMYIICYLSITARVTSLNSWNYMCITYNYNAATYSCLLLWQVWLPVLETELKLSGGGVWLGGGAILSMPEAGDFLIPQGLIII